MTSYNFKEIVGKVSFSHDDVYKQCVKEILPPWWVRLLYFLQKRRAPVIYENIGTKMALAVEEAQRQMIKELHRGLYGDGI